MPGEACSCGLCTCRPWHREPRVPLARDIKFTQHSGLFWGMGQFMLASLVESIVTTCMVLLSMRMHKLSQEGRATGEE